MYLCPPRRGRGDGGLPRQGRVARTLGRAPAELTTLAEALHARLRTGRSREEAARAVLAARAALDRRGLRRRRHPARSPTRAGSAGSMRSSDLESPARSARRPPKPYAPHPQRDTIRRGARRRGGPRDVALGAKTLSRLPTARAEFAALLALARRGGRGRPRSSVGSVRSRVAGRQAPLIALAEAVA